MPYVSVNCKYGTSSGIPNSLWREFAGYVCVETAGLAANSGPVKVIARMSLPPLCGQPTVVNKLRWGHSLRSRSSKKSCVIPPSFYEVCTVMFLTPGSLCPITKRCFWVWLNKNHLPLYRPSGLENSLASFFDRMALYFWFVFVLLILVERPMQKRSSKPPCENKTVAFWPLKTSHVFPLEDPRLMKSGRDNEKKRPEIRLCVVWVGK